MNRGTADLLKQTSFTELDRQFARFMTRLSDNECDELMLAALIVSNRRGKGDICVDIPAMAGKGISEVIEGVEHDITLPDESKWLSRLRDNSVVGSPCEYKPLILDEKGRLYLYRYWNYEQLLAENIKERLSVDPDDVNLPILRESLARLFPQSCGDDGIDVGQGLFFQLTSVWNSCLCADASIAKSQACFEGDGGDFAGQTKGFIILIDNQQPPGF